MAMPTPSLLGLQGTPKVFSDKPAWTVMGRAARARARSPHPGERLILRDVSENLHALEALAGPVNLHRLGGREDFLAR